MLHLDFETRSSCDLKKEKVYRYATDPYTQCTMASFAFDNGPVQRWRPGDPYPFSGYTGPIAAWNAGFERLIWNCVLTEDEGWPEVPVERFICIAATARANALPGALDNCARALGLRHQKDMDGHKLMMEMCKPMHYEGGVPVFNDDPVKLAREHDYCDQDVEVERAIANCIRPLSSVEQEYYWIGEHVNDRGLLCDTKYAEAALEYAEDEKEYFSEELVRITDGQITTPRQFQRIKNWLNERVSDDVKGMMKIYKKGEEKQTFDASTRHNILLMDDETPGFIDPQVRDFTEIIHDAGKSSISKYQSILNSEIDGVVNGLYMTFGAGQTGRASSVGLQVHNLKRDVAPRTEEIMQHVIARNTEAVDDYLDEERYKGAIVHMLAETLRPTIIARNELGWADWSAIEARALPWLAGDETKLDIFREQDADPSAPDVYERNAAAMGLADRQTGKVAELSLGYGGGVGAFQAMARNYNVFVDNSTANRIKKMWRETNPWAPRFWSQLERAAMKAINRPGKEFPAGRVSYMYTPGVLNGLGALWCKLPSDRLLCYPDARIEPLEMPWGEIRPGITAIKGGWKPKADETDWPRFKVWAGLMAENVTQATCACLLMDAQVMCHEASLFLIGHTHDELLIDTDNWKRDLPILKDIMETPKPWAGGIPLIAEVGHGKRYKEKT